VAAAAHKLKGAAQIVGATGVVAVAPNWSRPARQATARAAASCWARWPSSCAMLCGTSNRRADRLDPGYTVKALNSRAGRGGSAVVS
jgi:hypothetical protein